MATKSKKFKRKWKIFAIIILFACSIADFLCAMTAVNIAKSWSKDIIEVTSYYETTEFKDIFSEYIDVLLQTELFFQSEEEITAGNVVDDAELLDSFKKYYGIVDGIITNNTIINETYDGIIISGDIPEYLEDNFEEYEVLVETRLPLYRKMYIQNQVDQFRAYERILDDAHNFLYYIENGSGEIVASNATLGDVSGLENGLIVSSGFLSGSLAGEEFAFAEKFMDNRECKVYVGMADTLETGDDFYDLWQEYVFAKTSMPYLFGVATLASFVALYCVIYLLRVAGQERKGGEIQYYWMDKIYNEVHFALVFVYLFCGTFFGAGILQYILEEPTFFWVYILTTVLALIYLFGVGIVLSYLLSIMRQIKGRCFFYNTWIGSSIRRITDLFTGKTFRGWMVFTMLCYGLINCVLMGGAVLAAHDGLLRTSFLLVFAILAFNTMCIYLFIRGLRSLKKIMISAKETSKGNFEYQLDLDEISPSFLNFATDVAHIQDGLKNAVEEAIKGERMKSELITNVSHDLKTPLTSIISYVDLLRNEEIENETAEKYISVLYDKSYRLKQLIEDLIEASKVSSGNVAVDKTKIECRQLMHQALAEMEERLEASALTTKFTCAEPVFVEADGGHLWRILENLLSNVVKYAMPNSRVYVEIFEEGDMGVIIIKNVSATPVEFDESALTERFVRGDASRTTEGSGLGLSIVLSLVMVQDGTFEINVDGDLFKTIVCMPLWKEMEEDTEDDAEED
ncbi:HAMP domain-containing sensor histidine kinase [Chakrabartyella piscis]|uniref:sensor histidine kinase n=1 Tax=Chakrabartyella piscis TaxID=2918914 RepID=UPI0029584366|nr:HAMP domain-containing sensor histidine kinase [Chakrabartyella piscis]